MDVILTPPINIILSSAKLVVENEEDGVGTITFTIFDQPCCIVITSSSYVYDTIFSEGDRVRLSEDYGSLGAGTEGVLQKIIIDSTDDKAEVLFDYVVPNQSFFDETNVVQSGQISLLFTVPLGSLELV